MADILHEFPINAPISSVFEAISTPAGLDEWWTKSSAGEPKQGAEFQLEFGPGHEWRADVVACEPGLRFELALTKADPDWSGTRVGFELQSNGASTSVRFSHRGWPHANEHYRISCFCWAMYLRVLRRYLEHGERVPYEERLDV
jgi:uncharacterized protein YndB with AHSA1/START domain